MPVLEKAFLPKDLMAVPFMISFLAFLHLAKAFAPMLVTEAGMVIVLSLTQSWKAEAPIVLTLGPMVKDLSFLLRLY